MTVRPALLLAALAFALAAPAAHAQWKWKDPRGVVQYSDLPPPAGTADRDILQRPAAQAPMRAAAPAASAPAIGASAVPRGVDPELEARRKKAEQDEAGKKKAEEERNAAQRAENCGRARANLKALEDGLRISRMNAQGEREFLDDAQLEAQKVDARRAVSEWCK
jgi:Domain of unknown function (DUF4124)